jgi:AraC family transcriptional activator of pobA
MATAEPPFFYIYGEAPREIDPRFVHVERVRERDAIHGGHVRPHRHAHLYQLSFWTTGGGHYTLDGNTVPLPAQALTLIPPGTIHGFDLSPEADAIVVSISDDFRAECLDGADARLAELLRHPTLLPIEGEPAEKLARLFADIEQEYHFPTWAQADAISASLRLVLILAARLAAPAGSAIGAGGQSDLLARFLALVDAHFRERWTIARYVETLGVTPYLLNRATRSALGMAATAVVRERGIREAKRLLLYTMLTIAEVAFALGHDDPAHFSRAFRAHSGMTPAAWRSAHLPPGSG